MLCVLQEALNMFFKYKYGGAMLLPSYLHITIHRC